MPFCTHCGSSTETGQIFCPSCGASLPENGRDTPQSPHSSPVNSQAAQPVPQSAHPVHSPAGPNAAIFLTQGKILGMIAVIFLIAVGAFFAFSGSPQSAGIPGNTSVPESSGILPVNGQCSAGMSLCKGVCVDLQTDNNNCGKCGFSVPYGMVCRNGEFASLSATATTPPPLSPTASPTPAPTSGPCPSGQNLCSGKCADFLTDNDNCGKCGWDCPKGQICQSGTCLPPGLTPVSTVTAGVTVMQEASCSSGEIVCNGSCVNIFTDKKNCGVCGRTCGSQETCLNARCGPACPKSGTTLCDDTCVDMNTDVENCGSCGNICLSSPPNSMGSSCSRGECIISQCSSDYGDCNQEISDGCEANLRFDDNNCGSCGTKCPDGKKCSLKQCV